MAKRKLARNISTGIYFAGFVLYLVSFSSSYWVDGTFFHQGILRACLKDVGCYKVTTYPYMMMVMAFMISGLLVAFAGMVLHVAWLCKGPRDLEEGPTAVGRAAVAMGFITGVFNMLGSAIFPSGYANVTSHPMSDLSWAWYCGLFSAITLLVNGALTIVFVRGAPKRPHLAKRLMHSLERYSSKPYQAASSSSGPTQKV